MLCVCVSACEYCYWPTASMVRGGENMKEGRGGKKVIEGMVRYRAGVFLFFLHSSPLPYGKIAASCYGTIQLVPDV